MYGLKSADARRQYPKLLVKFLDFLSFHGTLEQKAAQLCEMANKNPDIIENQLTRFVIEHKKRVVLKQIAAGTLRNYVKAVRLFCKMNKIQISWELLAKGLPPARQYAEDRVPTLEEIKKLIAFPDVVIGNYANLGANAPNYNFPILVIFGIEVVASALLTVVILIVIHTKGLRGFSGIAIGGIVGLDIFFLSFISGASMNPARSLAPALISGSVGDLWLYWSATFVGTSIVALALRRKFISK